MTLREQLLACEPNFANTIIEDGKSQRPKIKTEEKKSETEAIENAIYSSDERGWPTTANAYILAKDPNPEIAQFVQSRLMSGQTSGGTDDVDLALDCIQREGESAEQFADRLKANLNPKKDE